MGVDFGNCRGINLSDPKYDKDAVNNRTMLRQIANSTGNTDFTVITATTLTVLNGIQFNEPPTMPSASSGLMWYSGGTMYVYSGNSASDLVSLY
jgi:predicted house-cleaning NTP pyrophosphatase (Maf/HAM1 superfamily)